MNNDLDLDLDFFANCTPPPPPILQTMSKEEMVGHLKKLHTVSTVFRIEKNGLGPYTDNPNWQKDRHCPRTGRCTPGSDTGFMQAFVSCEPDERKRMDWFHHLSKKSNESFLFGFSSMKQLHKWFHNHEELMELFKRGYKIRIYRNVQGFDSGSQVIFTFKE